MQFGIAFPIFLRYNKSRVEVEWHLDGCKVALGGDEVKEGGCGFGLEETIHFAKEET